MKKPSSNWSTNLALVIMECKAETGMEFGEVLGEIFKGLPMTADSVALVKALKNKLST